MRNSCLPRRPSTVLSHGDVTLSMPSAGDVPELAAYGADPRLLEGIWVAGSSPDPDADVHAWARTRLEEFRAGWQAPGGPQGAVLVIRAGGRLAGFLYLSPRDGGAVELSYGIAPPERGRGLATKAAEMATRWALAEGGFDRVLLYVSADHHAGHRVAAKAAFREVGRVETRIEQTGETFCQVVYQRE